MWWVLSIVAPVILAAAARMLWKRQVGRKLRRHWNRKWLEKRGVTEGETDLRFTTPNAFEVWRVERIDGGDVLLRLRGGFNERPVHAWVPMRRIRERGVEIAQAGEP